MLVFRGVPFWYNPSTSFHFQNSLQATLRSRVKSTTPGISGWEISQKNDRKYTEKRWLVNCPLRKRLVVDVSPTCMNGDILWCNFLISLLLFSVRVRVRSFPVTQMGKMPSSQWGYFRDQYTMHHYMIDPSK